MTQDAARDALRRGDLAECRKLLFDHVRGHPEDAAARIFLFQFLALTGETERAKKQLELYAKMSPEALGFAAIYAAALDAEAERAEVIAGRVPPPIFGPPERWMALLGAALTADAEGDAEAAAALRVEAMETAPASPGTVDGKPFAWISDADARFGPMLEAVIDGGYHWLPLKHVAKLKLEAPSDLRDLVWMEGALTLANGGEFGVLIHTRYPGAATAEDPALTLARRTDWSAMAPGQDRGEGQRMLATDQEDLSILDVREIVFDHGG